MLVGHQPSLGEIAAEIAWGTPQNYIEIKKGGACALELEITRGIPRGALLWLLTPSVLSSIHR
jgi:phosphohistidine phosphatase SixA